MPVRLIVFDLDGTLLGADNRLSTRTMEVLERASALDDLTLLAASGRSRWAAELVLGETAAIDEVICSNGAVLFDRVQGRVVRRRTLTPTRLAELHARVAEVVEGACWAWETEQGIVPDEDFRVLGERPGHELDELIASPRLELAGAPGDPVERRLAGFGRVVRGLLAHPELPPGDIVRRLRDRLRVRVPARLSSSSAIFLEVTAPVVHKNAMLRDYCAGRGIARDQVVAFGDHLNDLTMLKWAGQGFAMANAYPEVLARVPRRTERSNAEDGVALAIEKLIADR